MPVRFSTIAFVLAVITLAVTSQTHTVVSVFSIVFASTVCLLSYAWSGTQEVKIVRSLVDFYQGVKR